MSYETKKRIYRDAVLGVPPYPDDSPEAIEYRKAIDAEIEKYKDSGFTFGIPDE